MTPEQEKWKKMLRKALSPINFGPNKGFPSTRDAYKLKKELKGLVIGQTDKNLHELWFCCPELYHQAWDKNFKNPAYQPIFPKKFTQGSRETETAFLTEPPQERSKGKPQDIIKTWQHIYKKKGWDKIAPFDKKGDFNIPYCLFKAKNLNKKIRQEKWKTIMINNYGP